MVVVIHEKFSIQMKKLRQRKQMALKSLLKQNPMIYLM